MTDDIAANRDSTRQPRDAEARMLVELLRLSRVTVLYGGKGVGKTKLLTTGVLPLLRTSAQNRKLARNVKPPPSPAVPGHHAGDGADNGAEIAIVLDRWTSAPLEALHSRILDALRRERIPMVRPRSSLAANLAAWNQEFGVRFFILLDAFEQYLHAPLDQAGIAEFGYEFVRMVNEPSLAVNFLLSLRDESEGLLSRFQGQIRDFGDAFVRLSTVHPVPPPALVRDAHAQTQARAAAARVQLEAAMSTLKEVKAKAREEADARAAAEAKARAAPAEGSEARRRIQAEAEANAKAAEAAVAKAQEIAEEAARSKVQAEARAEKERQARVEAEDRAKTEATVRIKAAMEAKARAEAEARARADAESKARAAVEAQMKTLQNALQQAESRSKREAEEHARMEQQIRARQEAERKAREDAEMRAKAAEEAVVKMRAEVQAIIEAERKGSEDALGGGQPPDARRGPASPVRTEFRSPVRRPGRVLAAIGAGFAVMVGAGYFAMYGYHGNPTPQIASSAKDETPVTRHAADASTIAAPPASQADSFVPPPSFPTRSDDAVRTRPSKRTPQGRKIVPPRPSPPIEHAAAAPAAPAPVLPSPPTERAAAAPVAPAPAEISWQTAMRAELDVCRRAGFLPSVVCIEQVRWTYCAPNRWDTTAECMTGKK